MVLFRQLRVPSCPASNIFILVESIVELGIILVFLVVAAFLRVISIGILPNHIVAIIVTSVTPVWISFAHIFMHLLLGIHPRFFHARGIIFATPWGPVLFLDRNTEHQKPTVGIYIGKLPHLVPSPAWEANTRWGFVGSELTTGIWSPHPSPIPKHGKWIHDWNLVPSPNQTRRDFFLLSFRHIVWNLSGSRIYMFFSNGCLSWVQWNAQDRDSCKTKKCAVWFCCHTPHINCRIVWSVCG